MKLETVDGQNSPECSLFVLNC